MRSSLKIIPLLCLLFLVGCSRESLDESIQPAVVDQILPKTEINRIVAAHLQSTNTVYDWKLASDQVLFSALHHGQFRAAIGYRPAGVENVRERIHEIDLQEPAWQTARQRILDRVLAETERLGGERLSEKDIFVAPEDGVLPILELSIRHPELVELLRGMPEVRYLEPTDYDPVTISEKSGSGCDVSPDNSIETADFVSLSPGVKVPWNFYNMNIPQAWNTSRGDNVGICIIDTGTSSSQPKLTGSGFTSGYSGGRFISRYGTYVSSWWPWASPDGPNDQCGHGTQMAGLAVAPRTSGGATVGVAYQANLIAVRGTGDVIVNGGSEKRGVKDGLVIAGNRSDVQIVSMSIGDVFSSGTVSDGIYYAYNRGKLIFAAAGTSLTWTSWWGVIFPANMAQTVAVTGIRDGSSLQRCDTCHDGPQVDFVAVMQRASDAGRTSLTLSTSGNTPARVGGSSAATATTAGIAALVWATNLGQNRNQVLQRMKNAASIYPGRSNNFGWGIVDAGYAVTH
jgi:hypothetical protein